MLGAVDSTVFSSRENAATACDARRAAPSTFFAPPPLAAVPPLCADGGADAARPPTRAARFLCVPRSVCDTSSATDEWCAAASTSCEIAAYLWRGAGDPG